MDTCTLTHHHHQFRCTFGLHAFSFLQELLQKYLVDILLPRSPHICGFLVINPSTASSGVPLRIHASRASPFYSLEAIAGYLGGIFSAKQNGGRFEYSISPNRKLVARPLMRAMSWGHLFPEPFPLLAQLSGLSSKSFILSSRLKIYSRSCINGEIAARSQLASLVTAVIVILSTFYLLPALYYLPKCVLASMYELALIIIFDALTRSYQYLSLRSHPLFRGAP